MTTELISGISAINELTNFVNSASKVDGNSTFSDMLKANSAKQNEKANPEDNRQGINRDSVDAKNTENKAYTNNKKEIKAVQKTKTSDEDIAEEVSEAAEMAAQIVAEVLGVNAEVVADALDALDMTEADLLDTSNLAKLVVEISGAEDIAAIMTDENLFDSLKQITGRIDEILGELEASKGISYEQISDAISKLGQGDKTESFEVKSNETELLGVENEEIRITGDEVEAKTRKDAGNETQQGQQSWAEGVVENIKAAATEGSGESQAVYSADMEQIYEQVTESMKLNLSKDVTEMEINLHPASLGNVKIQIAAKDGVITANFTTQNEAVKAALETQLVQLKENMAEQGIKVEAIEVAVAAHAFEENLSKEGDSASNQGTENKRKRRSINLSEIDEIDDINIVEDDIRIAREMMMQNGTTVDYMA